MAQIDVVVKTTDNGEYLRMLGKLNEAPEVETWTEDNVNLCASFSLNLGYIPIDGFYRFCHIAG